MNKVSTDIRKVLVANRGEIAARVIRTARRLGIASVAVHSEADARLPYVWQADDAVELTGESPRSVYLDVEQIVQRAVDTGCDAVHPGYGFLSESPELARRVETAGLCWIGPSAEAMAAMSDKVASRNAVARLGVPVASGTTVPVSTVEDAVAQARAMGYPLMVKPSAGGGGIGMFAAHDEDQLAAGFASAANRAAAAFGNSEVLLERLVTAPRHIEIQVLGQPDGTVVAVGERDCSVQRRHQKLLEESPSPIVDDDLRARMSAAAVAVAESVRYRGAGTVEFLVDTSSAQFVFLEMNTRLQVEHGVTEMIHGIDLVEQQFRIAAGRPAVLDPTGPTHGHVIELRINAEDPVRFLPSPGLIEHWTEPQGDGIRVDAGYASGSRVSSHYDSLLAKLLIGAPTRPEAIERARAALDAFEVAGVKTNIPFFRHLLADDVFGLGRFDTSIVAEVQARALA